MSRPLFQGEGFELCQAPGTAAVWLRLWWDATSGAFDDAVLDIVRQVAKEGWDSLVIDLREAPPLANFPVRRRILATLKTAVDLGISTLVLVGPSSIQRRDVRRLCPKGLGVAIASDLDAVDRWLTARAS